MQHRSRLSTVVLLALVFLISLARGETSAETLGWTWAIEAVDPSAGNGSSLALDADGQPHIATAGGGIRYAYKDAIGWHSEWVESGDYAAAALVLGDDDTPHISYWSRSFETNGLKYAYKDTTGWHLEEVDSKFNSALSLGFSSSIALGADGYPRIAYLYDNVSASAITLKYAYKDATGWHPVTLYQFGLAGSGSTSLAVDAEGYTHIVTYRGTGYLDMVHVYQDVSGWHLETVADCGQRSQMRLDTAGYPHIAYQDCTDLDLRYAYKDATGWHDQTVDNTGETGYYPSLYLENNVPHIAYARSFYNTGGQLVGRNLRYVTLDGSQWVSSLVDDGMSVNELHGNDPSIAIGENGAVHISYAYRDGSSRDLMYAYGERELEPCTPELAIAKFKDLDGDGTQGQDEPFISWTYTQTVNAGVQTVQSPAGGWYTTTLTEGDTWSVSEHVRFNWTPTTPSSQTGTAACVDVQVLFGNTYTGFDIFLPLVVRQ